MAENDKQDLSRGSFKEKILRQLEENAKEQEKSDLQKFSRRKTFEPSSTEASSSKSELSSLYKERDVTDFEERQKLAKEEFLKASGESYKGISKFKSQENDQKDFSDYVHENAKITNSKEETSKASNEKFDEPLKQKTAEKESDLEVSAHARRRQNPSFENDDDQVDNEHMARKTSKKPSKKKNSKKRKKKTTAGKIIAIIVVVLVLTIAGTGWYGYNFWVSGIQPLNPNNHTVKAINIPAGSSSKQIGNILQRQGIIKNGTIFQYYTKVKNYTDFKSGYYNLSPDMSLTSIADELEKGGTEKPVEPVLGKITIPEGQTLDQISKTITVNANVKNGKTPFSSDDFLKLVQDPSFISKMKKAYPKLFASLPEKASGVKYQLEGYLFPATYEYTKKSTVESIATSMIDAMNTQLTPYYDTINSGDTQLNFKNVNELLSLAALVEKEANNDEDRRNVAGVFNNRIANAMPLQSNVSVLYAEGKLGTKTTLKEDANIDTKLNSPFNLYLNNGTGPGPVDSPSLSSIKAVISPAKNDYLYFVADVTNGKVYFAKTLEEQSANVKTYVNDKL